MSRTLTVYVVRHADNSPLTVTATLKEANAYLSTMREEAGGDLCIEWHVQARTFIDNSTGAADMMRWLLWQCADELIAGQEASTQLEKLLGKDSDDLYHGTPEVAP